MKQTDTRALFRPLCADLVSLFRSLDAEDWTRPTLAGAWRVREVAAHLLDTALRRLSFQRDRLTPPAPADPIASDRDLVSYVNAQNATWIAASQRLSPRVLTELYAVASTALAEFVETLPEDAPPLFEVSWAGDQGAAGWLDIGREFTEIWHHGAQIREAVGAGPFEDARWLRAVLDISMHALPHAYRAVRAPAGAALLLDISGPAGGAWTLRRLDTRWAIEDTRASRFDAAVRMADETAWRLLFNALSPYTAGTAVVMEGDRELAAPLLRARALVV